MVRDVLLNGIADNDIRIEALSADGIQERAVNEVIAFVESREIARNANPTSGLSTLPAYKRTGKHNTNASRNSNAQKSNYTTSEREKTAKCGKTFHLFTKKMRGWNNKPHERCEPCWKKQRDIQRAESSSISLQNDSLGQITGIAKSTSHQIFSKGEWRRAQIMEHPKVNLKLSVDCKMPVKPINVVAIADTGAQSDILSLDQFIAAGFNTNDLSDVSLNLQAANRSPIRIDGAFRATLDGRSDNGKKVQCRRMIYVSRDVKSLYLSYSSMLELGIINPDFPAVGMYTTSPSPPEEHNEIRTVNQAGDMLIGDICGASTDTGAICDCPRRTTVPDRPSSLPFSCCPENNNKMKEWLLHRFGSSTFNTFPHQSLPEMSGPLVEIHLQEGTKPIACHKAASIPLHWQDQVHADLLRDEALDVIERVPVGEPVGWCHRMVVTRKQDGSPRRTVDLSPLNKHCKRETHNSESPFHLARRIPCNTWKTVTDAWNGFHSVPLRESDRELTTFITPFGRWRYKRAPQGFLSSGDGYNRRFDAILTDFQRKERIVDDTIHYDDDLETHWWRTIDLLSIVGKAGIILKILQNFNLPSVMSSLQDSI